MNALYCCSRALASFLFQGFGAFGDARTSGVFGLSGLGSVVASQAILEPSQLGVPIRSTLKQGLRFRGGLFSEFDF